MALQSGIRRDDRCRQGTVWICAHLPCGVVALKCAGRTDRRGVSRGRAGLQCARRGALLATRRLPGTGGDGHRRDSGDDIARFAGRPAAGARVRPGGSVARRSAERVDGRPVADKLGGKTVAEVLPKPPPDMATVKSDDTIVEVAAIMARSRSPLVAVMSGKGLVGVITAARILEVALGALSADSAGVVRWRSSQ